MTCPRIIARRSRTVHAECRVDFGIIIIVHFSALDAREGNTGE